MPVAVLGVTAAARVTVWPNAEGFGLGVSVVVVAVPVFPRKSKRPLRAATEPELALLSPFVTQHPSFVGRARGDAGYVGIRALRASGLHMASTREPGQVEPTALVWEIRVAQPRVLPPASVRVLGSPRARPPGPWPKANNAERSARGNSYLY